MHRHYWIHICKHKLCTWNCPRIQMASLGYTINSSKSIIWIDNVGWKCLYGDIPASYGSHEKKNYFSWNAGCLMTGSLWWFAIYNPHITGQYNPRKKPKQPGCFHCHCFFQREISKWLIVGLEPGGLGFESGHPFHNNPFHKGIPGIQNHPAPNQQLTISWWKNKTKTFYFSWNAGCLMTGSLFHGLL